MLLLLAKLARVALCAVPEAAARAGDDAFVLAATARASVAETARLAERGGGWLLLLGVARGTFTAYNEDQAQHCGQAPRRLQARLRAHPAAIINHVLGQNSMLQRRGQRSHDVARRELARDPDRSPQGLTYGKYSEDRMHGEPPVEKPAATSPP